MVASQTPFRKTEHMAMHCDNRTKFCGKGIFGESLPAYDRLLGQSSRISSGLSVPSWHMILLPQQPYLRILLSWRRQKCPLLFLHTQLCDIMLEIPIWLSTVVRNQKFVPTQWIHIWLCGKTKPPPYRQYRFCSLSCQTLFEEVL